MILLDPDLDSDLSKLKPQRGSSSAPTAIPRNHRIPSAQTLARFLRNAQSALKLRGQVTVLLTTDSAIRRLNRQFRGKDKATDVLSFPAAMISQVSKGRRPAAPSSGEPERIAGDLAISIPTARRQAEERGHSIGTEIKVLMLHGLLHLAGYDHESDNGTMARREQTLRARLRLPHGLIERSTGQETENLPSVAKAPVNSGLRTPRLKSFPDTKQDDALARVKSWPRKTHGLAAVRPRKTANRAAKGRRP